MQQNEVYMLRDKSHGENFYLCKFPRSQSFKENSKNLHFGRFFKSPSGVGIQFSGPTFLLLHENQLCLFVTLNKYKLHVLISLQSRNVRLFPLLLG